MTSLRVTSCCSGVQWCPVIILEMKMAILIFNSSFIVNKLNYLIWRVCILSTANIVRLVWHCDIVNIFLFSQTILSKYEV